MLKQLMIAAALVAAAGTALAADLANVEKSFPLKDGSTVFVFKDGKMAMEDKLGRVVGMKQGHVMEAKDGQKLIMIGNEIARLDWIRKADRGGN